MPVVSVCWVSIWCLSAASQGIAVLMEKSMKGKSTFLLVLVGKMILSGKVT